MSTHSPYRPEIRFADIDAMGHVNNAVYFTYFEQARIHFFEELTGGDWDWSSQGILVARNEMDYRQPLFLKDQVEIHVGCSRIGTRSFTLTYQVFRKKDNHAELCSTGSSVLVCIDVQSGATRDIPARWMAALNNLLGGLTGT
jgi:acyl-CoA thioester hydrolase